jgi:hypothetical protein|tara:strand:+ start:1418 stop:1645 length:228 start_codon:yes stop_codon:yes gene_type:complete
VKEKKVARQPTLADYQKAVQRRFDNLNDEDREIIQSLIGTPQIRAIGRVLGSELMSVIDIESSRPDRGRRGLAAR